MRPPPPYVGRGRSRARPRRSRVGNGGGATAHAGGVRAQSRRRWKGRALRTPPRCPRRLASPRVVWPHPTPRSPPGPTRLRPRRSPILPPRLPSAKEGRRPAPRRLAAPARPRGGLPAPRLTETPARQRLGRPGAARPVAAGSGGAEGGSWAPSAGSGGEAPLVLPCFNAVSPGVSDPAREGGRPAGSAAAPPR